ncbi:alpha/beta hydrolase [Ruegeria jejuensis]|uniref:alpha/beta hydrolase n=1 Tax=Ruegeria jejuensis TaxID=3233338 RepID=UPI00355B4946
MTVSRARNGLIAAAMAGLLPFAVHAQNGEAAAPIPSTISQEAALYLEALSQRPASPPMPSADQVEIWEAVQAQVTAAFFPNYDAAIARFGVAVEEQQINGVPVVSVTPPNWTDNGKVVVYTHGGGYTFMTAKTTLNASASVAAESGLRVVSVDYTLAPQSKWEATTAEVVAVVQGLLDEGYAMDDIAIYGDSAGGALAAGSVLRMRDEGMGMPAAVVLWSPWSDIDTAKGDTYQTLKAHDPLLKIDGMLVPMALAYADKEDFTNPYVSPIYGDYSIEYPPTLIQGGTREAFLSNFVRHYQVLDQAGVDVTLDLYEGMPHVFQYTALDTPESKIALEKTAAFIRANLGLE